MYKQQTNPSSGIKERFCLQDQTAKPINVKRKIHIGILCLNRSNPVSYFNALSIGNDSTIFLYTVSSSENLRLERKCPVEVSIFRQRLLKHLGLLSEPGTHAQFVQSGPDKPL